MTNAEKLAKAMKEASEFYDKLPEWAKTKTKAVPMSARLTVRPGEERKR
jgi:hypothetical protein